jgi:AraC family transcriptional regulator
MSSVRVLNREPVNVGFSERDVSIVEFPATRVAVFEHRGDPASIGLSVQRFIAWRKQAGLPPTVSATFNILHGNPDTTPPADYRMDLCAGTDRPIAPNGAGVVAGLIPACRCATLRVVGPSHALRSGLLFLHHDWLPGSGETIGRFPLFVQRVTLLPDVPKNETTTDVFLPLA